jgi:hypothetical protein
MKNLLPAVLVSLLNACTPSVVEEMKVSRHYPPTYRVEVLDGWPEKRSFVELGTATTPSDDSALQRLKNSAMAAGADAIVLEPPNTATAMVPIGSNNAGSSLTAEPYLIPLNRLRVVYVRYQP